MTLDSQAKRTQPAEIACCLGATVVRWRGYVRLSSGGQKSLQIGSQRYVPAETYQYMHNGRNGK